MSEASKPHSGLSDRDYYAIVNAVTSRFDCDRSSGRGLVDRTGCRAEIESVLAGLFEQLETLREALDAVVNAKSYVVEMADGHPSIIVRTADEALEEAVEVARAALARYPATSPEGAGTEGTASRLADVTRLGEQVETLRQLNDRVIAERDSWERECNGLSEQVEAMQEARRIVDEQAEEDGLWFVAESVVEAYFQQELRRLHVAVEAATNPATVPDEPCDDCTHDYCRCKERASRPASRPLDPAFPNHVEGCICPRFKDIAPDLIADLTCPVHGVNGTDPGDVIAERSPATSPMAESYPPPEDVERAGELARERGWKDIGGQGVVSDPAKREDDDVLD